MASVSEWTEGARLRTLPAAISPVAAGTGAAAALGRAADSGAFGPDGASVPRALLALSVALALQLGVNFANDYSDGVRGTDLNRVGPMRLTASGAASPQHVKIAALACFAAAAVLGLWLVALSGSWWLVLVGAACIVAAWGYTGGARPYGYRGLGEVGVFVFFGLVAVLGTTFTQAGTISGVAIMAAIAIGLFACAVLVSNNQRDLETDRVTGKRTLSVRLGDRRSRWLYTALTFIPYPLAVAISVDHPLVLLTLLTLAPAAYACVRMLAGATGIALIRILKLTAQIELAYSLLLTVGLIY